MNKNIKSLEELCKIREDASKKVSLRESGENPEGATEILVGMAPAVLRPEHVTL